MIHRVLFKAMSIIDEAAEEAAGSAGGAVPPEGRPSPERPAIKLRNKKHGKVENGRLRPTSIHIFEDLEKNGVIPDKALSSYKVDSANVHCAFH